MTKSFGNVERAFEAEAEEAFAFLTTDFGLDAPRRDGIVIPTVTFAGPGLRYRVMLATDDRAVVTSIHLDEGGTRLCADLDEVAAAAGLTSSNQVRSSAHTLYALRGALRFQADLVRRLHPLLTAPSAADLLRRANA